MHLASAGGVATASGLGAGVGIPLLISGVAISAGGGATTAGSTVEIARIEKSKIDKVNVSLDKEKRVEEMVTVNLSSYQQSLNSLTTNISQDTVRTVITEMKPVGTYVFEVLSEVMSQENGLDTNPLQFAQLGAVFAVQKGKDLADAIISLIHDKKSDTAEEIRRKVKDLEEDLDNNRFLK